jgi:hypothetical protein
VGLLDFFKRSKKSKIETVKTEEPSPEQALFADTVLEIISPTVENFGFVRYKTEVKTYSTNIIYRKGRQYIEINSSNYPTDYPYYYNIVLGEGDSDDFFEYDWNSIAIWAMARITHPTVNISSYDFPYGDSFKESIEMANSDLLKYADTFLNGDLTIFHQARKFINQNREPYKIHTPDKEGNYTTTDEAKSVKQKNKYS